jgi:hypothetical protein
MTNNCLDKNLVLNSGTSQAQRALAALDAKYAQVDERKVTDLIIFAKKYGAYLNYYDLTNTITGDWQDFMSRDAAVGMSAVADWRSSEFFPYITNIYSAINSPQAGDPIPQQSYQYIYDFVFSLATSLNTTYSNLTSDIAYNEYLSSAILSNLATPLQQLFIYFNDSKAKHLFAGATPGTDPLAPFDEMIPGATLPFINSAPWVPANFVSQPITFVLNEDVSKITNHYFFTGVVNAFINGVINIVTQTPGYLTQVLENYPSHTPHYALFLSFLRLFKYAQHHLNGYTERHLQFYYKKVLQLDNNAGVPDLVHLIFQLQKNVPAHLLTAGKQFKAGKDANNNDLFYGLTDDIVVNQATVQAMRSLFLSSPAGNTAGAKSLYASPTANSADGQGAKLTTADQSWYAFGDIKKIQKATIGFSIASNLLFLNEGVRKVTIQFNCKTLNGLAYTNAANIFTAQFTGNKNWFEASGFGTNNVTASTSGTSLVITITISGSAPPVIPYSVKLHGGSYPQSLPMLQLLLADTTEYNKIRALVITDIQLTVAVTGVKNLSLQNDESAIDPSKPFKPFGQFPGAGSSLIIGSKEIFQKPLINAITINFTSADLTTSSIDNKNFKILADGAWSSVNQSAVAINSSTDTDGNTGINVGLTNTALSIPNILLPDFTANEAYKITSVNGFLKMQYASGSTLADYIKSIQASATVNVAGNPPSAVYQSSGATSLQAGPIANAITVDYQAQTDFMISTDISAIDFNSRGNFFYHVEPFGFREIHPLLVKGETLSVLSSFNFDDDTSNQNEGELWIGLANTQPGSTHSILFEVSEGSSNPLKDIATVSWYYMVANNWKSIDVADQTNSLSTSGLVVFNLTGDETTNNTRADNGLLWLKAVVNSNTDSVCKLINIMANAAKAAFVQNISAGIEFTTGIASNVISKAAVADGAIKQTSQPYGSFGGTPMETYTEFDLRVSERLRHKHRAVTAWDYERLVLQQFPQIHKVKCINHTVINTNTQQYSELKAGHVMVVTVPDLSKLAGANPLLPFTSVGLLNQINDYLVMYTSPFVHLHVCNPQLEGVRFEFDVSFKDYANITFYTGMLDAAITNFLMPWAFGQQTQDIEFGGKIEKSVVLNFVQSQPYVDFVTCFKMSQYVYTVNGVFKLMNGKDDIEEAIASTARSILVPYSDPAAITNNTIVSPANCDCK